MINLMIITVVVMNLRLILKDFLQYGYSVAEEFEATEHRYIWLQYNLCILSFGLPVLLTSFLPSITKAISITKFFAAGALYAWS